MSGSPRRWPSASSLTSKVTPSRTPRSADQGLLQIPDGLRRPVAQLSGTGLVPVQLIHDHQRHQADLHGRTRIQCHPRILPALAPPRPDL